MKKTSKRLALVLSIVTAFTSCRTVSDDLSLLILVDKSESITRKKTVLAGETRDERGEYLAVTRRIISAVGPGTQIGAAPISDHPLSRTSLPLQTELPPFEPILGNRIVYRDEVVEQKREVIRRLQALLAEGEPTRSTCIIDSLLLSEQLFAGDPTRRRVLAIFSDMLEDCGSLDFDTNQRPGTCGLPRSEAEVTLLLGELRKQGKIPNLKGVQVVVYGAAGGQQQDDSGARYLSVRRFWLMFFAEAGAEVSDYGVFTKFKFASDSGLDLSLPEERPTTLPTAAATPAAAARGGRSD